METVNFGHGHNNQWAFHTYPNSANLSIRNRNNNKELYYFQPNGQFKSQSLATVCDEQYINNVEKLGESSIELLRPIHYYNQVTSQNEYGFLAKEIQKVFPDLVNDNAINYNGLIPILVKEIQDLKKQINLLTDSNLCNSPCSSMKSADVSFDNIYNDTVLNGPTGPKVTFFIKPPSFRGVTGPSGII